MGGQSQTVIQYCNPHLCTWDTSSLTDVITCDAQALIDPVCFLTCYPHLLYNFVYKVPKVADLLSLTGLLAAARFFFSRDLIIAEVLPCSSKP
jgi:hypothetical protein